MLLPVLLSCYFVLIQLSSCSSFWIFQRKEVINSQWVSPSPNLTAVVKPFSIFSFNLKVSEFFFLRKCTPNTKFQKISAKFQPSCLWCPLPRSPACGFLLPKLVKSASSAFIFMELTSSLRICDPREICHRATAGSSEE